MRDFGMSISMAPLVSVPLTARRTTDEEVGTPQMANQPSVPLCVVRDTTCRDTPVCPMRISAHSAMTVALSVGASECAFST